MMTKYRYRISFWLFWILANAIGLGAGWVSGEVLGHFIAQVAGWRIGQVIAVLIFEGLLWIMRWVVLSHFSELKAIRPVEIIVWVSTEWVGWIIGEAPVQPDSLLQFTSGAVWAASLWIGIWMIFAFIKIPKPGKKFWQVEAVIRIFFAMGGGVVLTTISLVASLEIGETITKFGNLIMGMMAAGTILGTFLGAITGVLLVKLSIQRTFFSAKPAQHRLAR